MDKKHNRWIPGTRSERVPLKKGTTAGLGEQDFPVLAVNEKGLVEAGCGEGLTFAIPKAYVRLHRGSSK